MHWSKHLHLQSKCVSSVIHKWLVLIKIPLLPGMEAHQHHWGAFINPQLQNQATPAADDFPELMSPLATQFHFLSLHVSQVKSNWDTGKLPRSYETNCAITLLGCWVLSVPYAWSLWHLVALLSLWPQDHSLGRICVWDSPMIFTPLVTFFLALGHKAGN